MALVITPSLGQSGGHNSKALSKDRDKARKHYVFEIEEKAKGQDPADETQNSAVIVNVSDEGHQKIADEIDRKIQDAVDVMSTTDYLKGRSELLK